MNNIMKFEDIHVNVIEYEGKALFELYSTGMALGQAKISKGLMYPRKDRIDANIKSAEIKPVVHYGQQYLTEEMLYDLMLEMKTEKVKPFRKWVTNEVIPSIRKHGAYMTENVIDEVINNPDFGIKLLTEFKKEKEERKQLELQNKQKEQIIGELKPRADYTDKILKNKGLVTITQIAKDYGMSGTELNKLLHELKVQYKQSGQWLLYKEHSSKGYTHSETIDIVRSDGRPDIKMNTKWTQKGRLFLYNLLKEKAILPTIEQEGEKEIACN